MPAARLSATMARCAPVPLPEEAKLNTPGRARAASISAASVAKGEACGTTSICGCKVSWVIGAKAVA